MVQESSSVEHPATDVAGAVQGHEVTATTEAAGHGGEGGGLPQFQFQYWGGQIFWLLILFAIFYVLIAKVFTPRMRKVLDTRSETISGAIAEARKAQAEADDQAVKAKSEIADARSQAQRIASEASSKAKAESAARLAKEEAVLAGDLEEADVRIRAARDAAMKNVGAIAKDTAEAMVAKLSHPATAAELAKA